MYKTPLYEVFQIYMEKKRITQLVIRKAKREYWRDYCRKFNRTADIGAVLKFEKYQRHTKKYERINTEFDYGSWKGNW